MLIGYARVSTPDQTVALQQDALRQAGCERIFQYTMSGSATERPGLAEALAYVRTGDVLVVWKLDRLGRSLAHLIATIHDLQDQKVGFRSLQEQMDTTTPGGQLIFHIFGALAEFERALTQAGLAAARARGRIGGRPRSLSPDQVAMVQHLLTRPDMTTQKVALTPPCIAGDVVSGVEPNLTPSQEAPVRPYPVLPSPTLVAQC